MIKGFRDFLMRGNVVDLAVGVMIGAAFSAIVKSLVDDVITPFIGALGGTPDFSGITFTINGSEFYIYLQSGDKECLRFLWGFSSNKSSLA